MVFEQGAGLAAGTPILAADTEDEAGVITSVAPIANANSVTAVIGYLKTRFGTAGTKVRVLGAQGLVQ
jgi:hypothetical protein